MLEEAADEGFLSRPVHADAKSLARGTQKMSFVEGNLIEAMSGDPERFRSRTGLSNSLDVALLVKQCSDD